MSFRTTVTAGSWTQVGTGPATVQVISPDADSVEVMVACETAQPVTNSDGLVLGSGFSNHTFNRAQAIWAQVVQAGESALVACQPES